MPAYKYIHCTYDLRHIANGKARYEDPPDRYNYGITHRKLNNCPCNEYILMNPITGTTRVYTMLTHWSLANFNIISDGVPQQPARQAPAV